MAAVLIVMTDGRADCIGEVVPSLVNLHGAITRRVIHDDSGDETYRAWLRSRFPGFEVVGSGPRRGFGGAYRYAREWLRSETSESHVVHTEDDFVFHRPVDVDALCRLVDGRRYLAQVALRRQAWNEQERSAGGIVEADPWSYVDRDDAALGEWLEHRRFFTTNPSVYRRELLDVQWPRGRESEGRFGLRLFGEGFDGIPAGDVRSAFWGSRGSGVWVTHIGDRRAGTGY